MWRSVLQRTFNVRPGETGAALLAALFFFCVLGSYYILRPLREEMGLAGGVEHLPYLFLATLITMLVAQPLFGALVTRFPRRIFVPATYGFFIANLLIFLALLTRTSPAWEVIVGRVFYVWISVFNLFAVSLFWACMADSFRFEQSKRLFGLIAVGGTLGAIAGAGATASLVRMLGRPMLILFSVALLVAAMVCAHVLSRLLAQRAGEGPDRVDSPPRRADCGPADWRAGGHALSGIIDTLRSPYLLAACGYMFLYTITSTILYFQQANIVNAAVAARAERAALFASIDLWVNVVTLIVQLGLTGRILGVLGVSFALTAFPLATGLGFGILGAAPVLGVLVVFQVLRRGGDYAVVKPARETLFTVVSRAERYKAKSFIDTFVYRGGDALGASGFQALTATGIGLAGVAFTAIPLAVVWAALGLYLGLAQRRRAAAEPVVRRRGFPVELTAASPGAPSAGPQRS